MPDAAVASAPVADAPAKEHWKTREKRLADEAAALAATLPAVVETTITPPVPVEAPPAPVASPLPQAAPASTADPRRVILNPVEFAAAICTRNPRDLLSYQGGNSVSKLAGDLLTVYGAYLCFASPAYFAHVKAVEDAKPAGERKLFIDLGAFERMYDTAMGS